jgi:hypothetical protein
VDGLRFSVVLSKVEDSELMNDIIIATFVPDDGSIYLSIYLSMAVQSFVGPWPLFQFLNPIHSR